MSDLKFCSFLSSGFFGFLFAFNAGLLIMLSLPCFSENPRTSALPFESFDGIIQCFILADFDLRHLTPSFLLRRIHCREQFYHRFLLSTSNFVKVIFLSEFKIFSHSKKNSPSAVLYSISLKVFFKDWEIICSRLR